MRKILLILLVLFLISCKTNVPVKDIDDATISGMSVRIIEVDSCEYIANGAYKFAHKGNCKYCAERLDKKLDSLYIRLSKKKR